MADIRINALAGTATSAASDDYLALDGAANGTRKILASNIAQNVSDVVLGTNGPSVKSSLDARAARQGLVFDGTAGTVATLGSALGTSDFSVDLVASIPSSNPSNPLGLFVSGANNTGNGFQAYINSSGLLVLAITGATGGDYRFTQSTQSLVSLVGGKIARISIVRDSVNNNRYVYLNGVSLTMSGDGTGGTPPNWSGSLTSTTFYVGKLNATDYPYNGSIGPIYLYNRALSASEVVSLFEAGVPSGADYNNATNTSQVTSAFITRPSYVYTTFSGASATGFTAADSSGTKVAQGGSTFTVRKNSTYLVTFTATLTSGVVPSFRLWNSSTLADVASYGPTITAGSNSFVLTGSTTDTSVIAAFVTTGATSYAISNFSVTPLGLLLAPDAGQAGGGLTWYDTSGNAASITLPASGVSWNVPTSGKIATNFSVGGTLTVSDQVNFATGKYVKLGTSFFAVQDNASATNYLFSGGSGGTIFRNGNDTSTIGSLSNGGNLSLAGNLTVSGTGSSSVGGNLGIGTTTPSKSGGARTAVTLNAATGQLSILELCLNETLQAYAYASATQFTFSAQPSRFMSFETGNTEQMRLTSTGNLLLGTTTDSGAKLQIGTNTTTASGGAIFGTDTNLFRQGSGFLALNSTGNDARFYIKSSAGTNGFYLRQASDGNAYFWSQDALSVIFGTNNTTALTLDSSQAATFSQGVKISGLGPVFSASSSAVYNQIVGGVTPQIQWINSSGGTDSKVVDWLVTSNQLQGRFVNDTNGAANNWLTVTRSNYSVTSVAFGGPIKLANAYVATPQVSTGYVTIQDSTGTTYKVLVAP